MTTAKPKNSITLSELHEKIKAYLNAKFTSSYWIVAEIGEIHISQSGHCFMQLVEKENDEIIAKMKANIWANTFHIIKPYFETTTGIKLQTGVKILIKTTVNFDEVYGLSLSVLDIEPGFTRGIVELQRKKIYQTLLEEGIAEMNKNLLLPDIPKNIAIISSLKAAGYEDFINELKNNPYKFKFHYHLFNATMQGKKTTETIIAALDRILQYENTFDIVVILRGGGDETDISSFDSYHLGSHIAQFPLPVICAIGHERDETIIDLVASSSLKTPTAAAHFFIQKFLDLRDNQQELSKYIQHLITSFLHKNFQYTRELSLRSIPLIIKLLNNNKLSIYKKIKLLEKTIHHYHNEKKYVLAGYLNLLNQNSRMHLSNNKQSLTLLAEKLKDSVKSSIKNQKQKLILNNKLIQTSDPKNVLKRGYSISFVNKKPVLNGKQLKTGTIIETKFHIGKKRSKIITNN